LTLLAIGQDNGQVVLIILHPVCGRFFYFELRQREK